VSRIGCGSSWHQAEDLGTATGPTAIRGTTGGDLDAVDLPGLTRLRHTVTAHNLAQIDVQPVGACLQIGNVRDVALLTPKMV
jgi:hypothetical protein